jgi:ribosomal protein S8
MLTNKQLYNKEFFHLITSIKKASSKGLEILFFKKTGDHSKILKLLISEGFITAFQDYSKFLVIRIKISNNKAINLISATKRIGRKNFTVSFKELLKLQRQEGFSSYYVLNTDQGLITSFIAIEKSIGGKLLFKIS